MEDNQPNIDTSAAGVAREAIVTIALLRTSLKSQASELQVLMKHEVRQAGAAFKAEAHNAGDALHRRMEDVLAKTNTAVDALNEAQKTFAGQRRRLLWGLGAVVLLCLASLVATYEGLYGFYQGRYDRLVKQVNYLEAVNAADLAPCGDGRLCARVDDKAARVGDKRQYRVVERR